MAFAFKLPELGENIETGDVVNVLVSVGDTLEVDQPVVELETDKATVEVPAPAAGKVTDIAVKAGDTIGVGQVILTIGDPDSKDDANGGAGSSPPAPAPEPSPESEPVAQRPAKTQATEAPTVSTAPKPTPSAPRGGKVLAAPSIRRLAREFGVDITVVPGSGARGRVTAEDVKVYARQVMEQARQGEIPASASASASAVPALPDFEKWGVVERTPMRGIRRATSRQMTQAWTIPHVTQHDRADVGQFESARARFKKETPDVPLTVTAFAVKVLAAALKVFPQFNASIDVAKGEVVHKQYISIGVAVDTDRGLLVPVVRQADQKTLTQISKEIAELAGKARSKALTVDELQGGTFTVTNLGGLGGTLFTPIINHPEVAILGLSRSTHEPVMVDGAFQPRLMLPLSLSYDHRLIDGANAVRFLRWVADRLEHPLLLGLE